MPHNARGIHPLADDSEVSSLSVAEVRPPHRGRRTCPAAGRRTRTSGGPGPGPGLVASPRAAGVAGGQGPRALGRRARAGTRQAARRTGPATGMAADAATEAERGAATLSLTVAARSDSARAAAPRAACCGRTSPGPPGTPPPMRTSMASSLKSTGGNTEHDPLGPIATVTVALLVLLVATSSLSSRGTGSSGCSDRGPQPDSEADWTRRMGPRGSGHRRAPGPSVLKVTSPGGGVTVGLMTVSPAPSACTPLSGARRRRRVQVPAQSRLLQVAEIQGRRGAREQCRGPGLPRGRGSARLNLNAASGCGNYRAATDIWECPESPRRSPGRQRADGAA
jgi:hypothetical protein